MTNDLKLVDKVDVLYSGKLILYGAGHYGVRVLNRLRELNIRVDYFCDGSPEKWDSYIEGLRVLSPLLLKKLDNEEPIIVIISIEIMIYFEQVVEDIKWLQLKTDNIFTAFALTIALIRSKKAYQWNNGFYKIILDMQRDKYYAKQNAIYLEMRINWAKNNNIMLVYSCTKTGSITMQKSLSELNIQADHLHGLGKMQILQISPIKWDTMEVYASECREIIKTRKTIKVISIVRDPIIRLISAFFQCVQNEFLVDEIPITETFMESVIAYLRLYKNGPTDLFDWFDNEIKNQFDIDVFAHSFNKDAGYSIIENGNVELLVLKLEKLYSLEPIIAEFIGVPRFKLVNANESEQKFYKHLYKQVLKEIIIPPDILEYYQDPRMRKFYNEAEITSLLDYWSNK